MLTNCRNDLPNPHKKCIKELLNTLTCFENDYQRITIDLRKIQKQFKQSVDNVVYQCSEMRKLACASDERLKEFQQNVENIDVITESFNKRIEDIQKKRHRILEESKNMFEQLHFEKLKFKQFHENTINFLKAHAVQSNDPEIVRNCEKDLNEMNKQFSKEVFYIKKCESILNSYYQLLYVGQTEISKCNCLNVYDWTPKGKSIKIEETVAKEIQSNMGTTLRRAFAQLHIHQPKDKISFLAQYLMTLERNEDIMNEKFQLFYN